GGGSTELVLVDTRPAMPAILDWHSVPWGVVSLTESIGHGGTAAYTNMRERVRESIAPFAGRLPGGARGLRLLGTSGTVTTLASVHLGLTSYDRSVVDGLLMPAAAMRSVSRHIAGLDMAGRSAVPCIGHERADLVVAGCAILEEILDLWPAEQLGIADRGIREGILRRLMGSRH
ncbi:Ppx/GppA phosphatase family protein, partial [Sphingomonas sp.]|uniref:Ppx/GppA phosphatase family protein n=1 Tax=Sphingomonas sp. TaxID=28214 RepID=UPI002D0F2900|nr:Ppx/GppA family phosphatase [Sphingomonas sp.]